jgi:hypothetical protein
VDQIADDLELVLRALNHQDPTPHSGLQRLVYGICELVEERLATFHLNDMPLDQLVGYVQVSHLILIEADNQTLQGPQHCLERMAAEYLLSERRHLQGCYNRWRSIAR